MPGLQRNDFVQFCCSYMVCIKRWRVLGFLFEPGRVVRLGSQKKNTDFCHKQIWSMVCELQSILYSCHTHQLNTFSCERGWFHRLYWFINPLLHQAQECQQGCLLPQDSRQCWQLNSQQDVNLILIALFQKTQNWMESHFSTFQVFSPIRLFGKKKKKKQNPGNLAT